jgi:hypothetical protein
VSEPGCEHDTQIMLALRALKENPWDSITLHYDAGEWGITLHEDAARTVEIEPGESLLDRLNAAIQYTRTGNEALLSQSDRTTERDWQPIESAPKDGRPILIWQPDEDAAPHDGLCDDRRYAIGYRRPAEWPKRSEYGNRNSSEVTPTHWMPLPEPPSA